MSLYGIADVTAAHRRREAERAEIRVATGRRTYPPQVPVDVAQATVAMPLCGCTTCEYWRTQAPPTEWVYGPVRAGEWDAWKPARDAT